MYTRTVYSPRKPRYPMEGHAMRNNHVSIIIQLTEHDARLPRLLHSLAQQKKQVDRAEILIAAPEDLPVRDIVLWNDILHDGSIRITPLPPGTAPGESANKTIRSSTGSYLLCLRPDYRVDPNFFSTVLQTMADNPDIDVAYPDYIRLPYKGNRSVKNGYTPLPDFSHDLLRTGNFLGPAVMFRREVWDASDGFRDNTTYSQWDFWVQAALRGFGFEHIPYPLASCDHRPVTFRERAEDARNKAMIVVNNQAYFHLHTVRWALAHLRGDAWAASWDFMHLPGPVDVSKMMFEHNVRRMRGGAMTQKAVKTFPGDRNARTI